MSKKGHCFLLQVTRPSHSTEVLTSGTKRPCTQHTSTARGKSRTAVAIRKTARFQGLDCNRGRHATQRNSTNLPSDGDRGGPPFVLLAPRAPLFSSHPAIASPTPVSRLAWRERSSHKPEPRTAQQQGGRGKGEAWEGCPRGSQSQPPPPRLPYAEQKPASGSGRPLRAAPCSRRRHPGRRQAEIRPGPGRRLVSAFPGKEALACLDGLLACFVLRNPIRPASSGFPCCAARWRMLVAVNFPKFCWVQLIPPCPLRSAGGG